MNDSRRWLVAGRSAEGKETVTENVAG